MAAGNSHLGYKGALNGIEAVSPGTKANFYFSFLDRVAPRFAQEAKADDLGECRECGAPTPSEVCAFCRLVERATRVEISR